MKISVEINEKEKRKTKSIKPKLIEKINRHDELLAGLTKKKREKSNTKSPMK